MNFLPKSFKNRAASAVFTVSLFLFIITFSIGLPIYFRPFYYWHIKPLGLTDSGFTAVQIKQAYNAVLDYLTFPWNSTFSCGDMKFSKSGAAHFADCKVLFNLNGAVLLCTAIIIVVLLIINKRKNMGGFYIGKAPATLVASGFAVTLVAVIGVLIAIDFESAFYVFHSLFFAGKDNWQLYPKKDQIINVLPLEFFANCAVLIASSILLFFVVFLAAYIIKKKRGGHCG